MRVILNVFAVLLVIAGCVFFLQGINVLPGSFMTGQTRWAVIGGLCVILGILILMAPNKRTSI
jgi:hypothetical protein